MQSLPFLSGQTRRLVPGRLHGSTQVREYAQRRTATPNNPTRRERIGDSGGIIGKSRARPKTLHIRLLGCGVIARESGSPTSRSGNAKSTCSRSWCTCNIGTQRCIAKFFQRPLRQGATGAQHHLHAAWQAAGRRRTSRAR